MGFGPKYPMYNKLLGMFANLPIGLPFSVTFKYYHLEHHRVINIIYLYLKHEKWYFYILFYALIERVQSSLSFSDILNNIYPF